jgi:hypothetical protein
MITFKEYIAESVDAANAFNSAKQISNYITSDRYKSAFIEATTALADAAHKKEIYNSRFNEHKNSLMKGIEYAYKTLFDAIKSDIIKSGQETSDLWSVTSAADINKIAKIYDKMNPQNKKATDFVNAIRDIPNAIKSMKPYIKSGREPKAPVPGQFVKPLATLQASKLAIQFMTEATQTFKTELKENVTKQIMTAYNKIKEATLPSDISNDATAQNIASMIFIVRTKDKKKYLELKDDADARVSRLINDNVDGIVNSFITKNASKLALILQKKDAPKTHKIVKTNIQNGMVENTMQFEFNDGSSFILESSVVYKTSQNGKLFFQYPTRFRNVKLADGTLMTQPSEQKMIKEF